MHKILTAVAHIVWEADNVEEAKELALPGQQAIILPIWSTIIANMSIIMKLIIRSSVEEECHLSLEGKARTEGKRRTREASREKNENHCWPICPNQLASQGCPS